MEIGLNLLMVEEINDGCVPDNVQRLIIQRYLERPDDIGESLNIFRVSRDQIKRIISHYVGSGRDYALRRRGKKNHKLRNEHKDFILNLVDEDCQLTLKVNRERLQQKFSITVSTTTIEKVLNEFNYSFKRRISVFEKGEISQWN